MKFPLKVLSIIAGILIFILIIDLVRRRRLREEYSWLWIAAGIIIFSLPLSYEILIRIGDFFGGIIPSTILYLLAILFLILVNIHYSVKVSELHNEMKDLAQEVALLKEKTEREDNPDE